jgi:hypothetical protein
MADATLSNLLVFLLLAALSGWWVWFVQRLLRRTRPELDIAQPLVAGVAFRLAILAVVGLTGVGVSLRGPDEPGHIFQAHRLAALPFGTNEWITDLGHQFHLALFGAEVKLFGATPTAMRLVQIAICLTGLLCLIAAAHDLAGPRAGRLAAWFVMLEPAGAFFSSILHKEPLIFLALGLVALGATHAWKRLDATGVALMVAGCAVALVTRSYIGYFIIGSCLFTCLHASLLHLGGGRARAIPVLVFATIGVAVALGPAIRETAPNSKLFVKLQRSQGANSDDPNANLALERIDTSSREGVLLSIPRRIRDVLIRPYPWQLKNLSQQMGFLGTLAALVGLFALLRALWRTRGAIMRRAGPLIYPGGLALVGYSISTGNAGTGFRYRTTVLAVALTVLAVLLTRLREEHEEPALELASNPPWRPVPPGSLATRT